MRLFGECSYNGGQTSERDSGNAQDIITQRVLGDAIDISALAHLEAAAHKNSPRRDINVSDGLEPTRRNHSKEDGTTPIDHVPKSVNVPVIGLHEPASGVISRIG